MKNKATALLAAFALATAPAFAGIEHLMPKPLKVEASSGGFSTANAVKVTDPTNTSWLTTTLSELGIQTDPAASKTVTVEIVDRVADGFDYTLADFDNEGYELSVTSDAIKIKAVKPIGVIRAAQTLSQLAMEGNGTIPAAEIQDRPAFKLRGFMQDVGRSFLSVDELKREIDLLSRFKINTFHWHLTDITGWRLEIKAYPQLTSNTAITRYPGMFYTQADAKEIQDYAAERGMTVIPEIDMPGHSNPFERAMGHGMQTTEGIAELKVILTEVCTLFDKAPYIHIGGDEVKFEDSYIIDMIDYIHNLGKKVVIWNQYNRPSKKVDPTVIPCDLTTNWATSGALSAGVPNIDMRYNYTNHFDVFADVVGIYKSTIFGATQGNPDIAGTISAAWCDTKVPDQDAIMRMNNIYANVLASGERAWVGGGKQYIEQGGTTLPNSGDEFNDFADWERRFIYHKNSTLKSAIHQIPYVRQTDVKWNITDQIPNGGSKTATLAPENFIGKETVPESFDIDGTTYGASKATGAGIYLRHIWHGTVKGFYNNPQNNMTAYAWTYVYSPTEQDAGAFIEFYSYSRSGNETGPIAGEWDRRGSRIWLNGNEIAAPQWQQPGKSITQNHATEGLSNENFTNRPATQIHLKEGWNQVFMKLPHVNSGGTGRDKWMFTFVITDKDGNDALDGLTYSPAKCIDSNADALAAVISDARALIRTHIGEKIGYKQSTDLDANLAAKADELEATLSQAMTADERATQIAALQSLIDAFNAGIDAVPLILPLNGASYHMHTPERGSRYVSDSNGALTGVQGTPAKAQEWIFTLRADNTFDIKNAETGKYISKQGVQNNNALKLVADAPADGWEIKLSETPGLVIIVSGSAQFNQTNKNAENFAIYNWGGGTNISDTGCKYAFTLVDSGENPDDPNTKPDDPNTPVKDFVTAGHHYYIYAPLRANRYVTEANGTIIGERGTPEDSWIWLFEGRPDNTFNIKNAVSGNYICAGTPGEPLITSATEPAAGWEVKPAERDGYAVIISGSNQFNQSNTGNFNVTNEGNGTELSAVGNLYKLEEVEYSSLDVIPAENSVSITGANKCIIISPASVKAEVFNLQGMKIAEGHGIIPATAGTWIVKAGTSTQKVHVN